MSCRGKTSSGSDCRAKPIKGSGYCFTHDPERREEHLRASRKGGLAKSDNEPRTLLPPIDLTKSEGMITLLADTINRVRSARPDGTIDIATANSIGHLGGKLIEAHKMMQLSKTLTANETPDNLADLFSWAYKEEKKAMANA